MGVYGKHLHTTDVRFSPHTLRHTFACSYLKAGGNLEYLRRILGHSSLLITQRYLQSVGVVDLADVHNDFSPIPPTRGGKGYDDAAMGRGLTNVETTVAVATGDVRWVLTRRSDEDSTTLGVCGTGSRVGGWDGLRPGFDATHASGESARAVVGRSVGPTGGPVGRPIAPARVGRSSRVVRYSRRPRLPRSHPDVPCAPRTGNSGRVPQAGAAESVFLRQTWMVASAYFQPFFLTNASSHLVLPPSDFRAHARISLKSPLRLCSPFSVFLRTTCQR